MATERDIARLLNEEIGPRDSDYVASVLGDYFCDETSETDYEAVEDMEEEEVEEEKEEEKETKDCDEDINPPLFDPEVAVELQVSDLDLESAMPDAPATSTTHSGDDMRKEDLQEEEELSKFFEHGWLYTDAANNYNPPLTRPLAMLNIVAHYSFDYAQQVHYPSSPLQAGPIYFLTPRKCGIFGVCCEAIPQQVNFLIDESFDTGKGANPVISMVHFHLKNHGLNSVSIHFNADNCTGQNKNNTVIQYLLWRVMTGLNASISISFLPVGHTKFSPDWCFGLLKQKFRKAEVDSLDDFIQVVEQSSAVNKTQPVGSSNGELIVETLDWCSYFATLFKKIKGIKGFQHFVVNATSPGVVAARQAVDGQVTQFNLLKEDAQIMEDELPNILPPKDWEQFRPALRRQLELIEEGRRERMGSSEEKQRQEKRQRQARRQGQEKRLKSEGNTEEGGVNVESVEEEGGEEAKEGGEEAKEVEGEAKKEQEEPLVQQNLNYTSK
uniref:DUF7869 domain-containing protein n=2 Tax=Amphimedon queenslandica TaxID=400682 RepID=A0A1X7VB99_AMPQE